MSNPLALCLQVTHALSGTSVHARSGASEQMAQSTASTLPAPRFDTPLLMKTEDKVAVERRRFICAMCAGAWWRSSASGNGDCALRCAEHPEGDAVDSITAKALAAQKQMECALAAAKAKYYEAAMTPTASCEWTRASSPRRVSRRCSWAG